MPSVDTRLPVGGVPIGLVPVLTPDMVKLTTTLSPSAMSSSILSWNLAKVSRTRVTDSRTAAVAQPIVSGFEMALEVLRVELINEIEIADLVENAAYELLIGFGHVSLLDLEIASERDTFSHDRLAPSITPLAISAGLA